MSEIHALSGAYAVDAVDDVERGRFERHLADCAACREEVASLREAAALLVDPAAPRAELKDQVMAQIATFRPLPPVVEPATASPRASRRPGPRALIAAAAVVAVLGGGVAWHPWDRATQTVEVSAAARVLSAPDAETFRQSFPSGGSAVVTRSKALNRAVISTKKMPVLPDGKVYELWFQQGSRMIAAGFLSDDDTAVVLSGDAATATAVGITTEPEGGSPEPTLSTAVVIAMNRAKAG